MKKFYIVLALLTIFTSVILANYVYSVTQHEKSKKENIEADDSKIKIPSTSVQTEDNNQKTEESKEEKPIEKEEEKSQDETKTVFLDVPLVNQLPELYNGCEITSVTMLLKYRGINIDKLTLAKEMKKDPTPVKKDSNGDIIIWGNPKKGFVGDVYGKEIGYSIDPIALLPLVNEYTGNKGENLTGLQLVDLEKRLLNKQPIAVWVTASMNKEMNFRSWIDSEGNNVQAFLGMHCVVLTGMDEDYYYYNDPLEGIKNAEVLKEDFSEIWIKMGKKALSIKNN